MPLYEIDVAGSDLLENGDGTLADGPNCCCETGCCNGQLVSGDTVLIAEVTADSTGCFTVGSTMCMDDLSAPNIWSTQSCDGTGFMGVASWRGLLLSCDEVANELVMIWDSTGTCPLIDTSAGGNYGWRLVSAVCDPFEFVFEYDIDETGGPGCNCDGTSSAPGTVVGTVQVTITISP